MQITPLKLNINTPQFKAQKYQEIKHLPKLRCACCDKKMIDPLNLVKAFAATAKPLSKMMDKGVLDHWKKHQNVWNMLEGFAQKFPKMSLDKILMDKELRTNLKLALLDKAQNTQFFLQNISEKEKSKILDKQVLDDYGDILNRSRDTLKGAGAVMKRMAGFKKCLSGEKLDTFEQLEIYAQKYPRKSLKEIINMDEIYKFHKTKDLLQRAETREKLDYHFNKIEKLIKKVDPSSEDLILDLKEEALKLFEHTRDADSRIFLAKKIYKNALSKYNNKNLEKKVLAELEQIPTSFITKDSFLVYAKNHDYGDSRIIASLLVPAEVSFEHIIPRKENGEDHATNGLVLCRDCNQKRGTTPYEEFIQYHPRMRYNIQKQILTIGNYILQDRLDSMYRFWPIKVAQTINDYSNGAINPDISKYVKKALEKSNQLIEENEADLKAIKKERDEKFKEKEKLLQQLEDIKKTLINLKEEKNYLQEQNKVEKYLNYTLNEYLEEK